MKVRTVMMGLVVAAGMLFAGAGPASAAPRADALAGIGTYRVTFSTGDLPNADTDDAVRFAYFGTEASSDTRVERDFRRGEVYTFGPYNWVNLGTISKVIVTKSNEERDAWYLNYVQIHEQGTGHVYLCEANRWFPQTGPKREFICNRV